MAKKNTGEKTASRKTRTAWTDEMNERLSDMYPKAAWEEIHAAFPECKRGALIQQATRLGLRRPAKGSPSHQSEPKKRGKNEPVTNEQIARFMTRGRSIQEVAKAFGIAPEEAEKRVTLGFKEFDLHAGPKNLAGEATFVAVPHIGTFQKQDRAWNWMRQANGQPYGVVTFPDDFNHQKLRLIPLDGILYGDNAHDADRFQETIKRIARTPNTFCYLNGDIIGDIKGGKKQVVEQLRIDRSVECAKLLHPIAHKILWAQQGCVEARVLSQQGFDPLAHLCNEADIPYFDEPVYADILWKGQLFTIWTMHGHSTAQLVGAQINSLRRPAHIQEYTHFVVGGHIGNSLWNRIIKLCRDPVRGRLIPREEYHVVLGNFKKYFGTRAARRGETPPSNETIVLYMYPDGQHHVKTEHGGKS
jgi:hypothetical protein